MVALDPEPAAPVGASRLLGWKQAAALFLFSLALFGYSTVGGRPLTMHEARLPQSAREMLAGHEWLLPTVGGRPWVERPPLPHWIVIGMGALAGGLESPWVARLASALAGCLTVLLVAWTTSALLGRRMGLIAGLLL